MMPDMTKFVWKLSAYVAGFLGLLAVLSGAYAAIVACVAMVGAVPVMVAAALIVGGMVTAAFIHSRATPPSPPSAAVGAGAAAVGRGPGQMSSDSWTEPR